MIGRLFRAEADESAAEGRNHVVIMFTEMMRKESGSWDLIAGRQNSMEVWV